MQEENHEHGMKRIKKKKTEIIGKPKTLQALEGALSGEGRAKH